MQPQLNASATIDQYDRSPHLLISLALLPALLAANPEEPILCYASH